MASAMRRVLARRLGLALRRHFLTGLFVVGPISVSLLVLLWLVSTIDRAVAAPLQGLVGHDLPGLGIVLAPLLILGAGFLASNVLGRHLLGYIEELLARIPGFNWLYKTVKQMADVFSPESKLRFQSVVLAEYPCPGTLSLGFVTKNLTLDGAPMVCVYIPTNHLYIGNVVLLPADKARPVRLSTQEGVQALLSAGAALPDALRHRPPR